MDPARNERPVQGMPRLCPTVAMIGSSTPAEPLKGLNRSSGRVNTCIQLENQEVLNLTNQLVATLQVITDLYHI